jgi:hypothetical protein
MDQKTYKIGELSFYQAPLMLGQIEYLSKQIVGVEFSYADPMKLIIELGERFPKALACVLIPVNEKAGSVVKLWDAHGEPLKTRIDLFRDEVNLDLAVELVTDFFACNQSSSLFEKLRTLSQTLPLPGATSLKISKPSMPSSREETTASAPSSANA